MRKLVKLTGMVLRSVPVGEYDERLVLFTGEQGKLTVSARGVKCPGSMLMGPSRPFASGTFELYEGWDAYNLHGARITNYFDEISMGMEQYCRGQYLLEFTGCCSRENLGGSTMPPLLYQSLRTLLKLPTPNQLIQRMFELWAMVDNGEYTEHLPREVNDSANYTWEFVVASPLESLYTFQVTDSVSTKFKQCAEINKARYVGRDFHSLEILKALVNWGNGIENASENGYNLYIYAKFRF